MAAAGEDTRAILAEVRAGDSEDAEAAVGMRASPPFHSAGRLPRWALAAVAVTLLTGAAAWKLGAVNLLSGDGPVLHAPSATDVAADLQSKAPLTETVKIDGVEVFSQSSGHALLNECSPLSPNTARTIEVCGTQTKVTVWLRAECREYAPGYHQEIGTCNTKVPSSTCVSVSPSDVNWLHTAQSYEISQC